ncbi:MAG: ROK family protein [Actinomycetes bacterium]
MGFTVGVDVGGTKASGVLVDAAGTVVARTRRPSASEDYSGLVDSIVATVQDLQLEGAVEAVGLAVAGNVNEDRSRVVTSPNIPPLKDQPLRDELQARLGLPVVLENDANAAAWGEYRFGRWSHTSDVVVLTVGTGLGAGLVMDGELRRGAHGFAGEPGHVPVVPEGRPCPCGGRGCWEQYASGTALLRYYRDAGGNPRSDGPVVTAAAQAGDVLALAAFDEVGRWLGFGLAGVVALLDPGLIVLGGGVAEAGELLLEPTRVGFARSMSWDTDRVHPALESAVLGNDAGAVGAAALAAAL